jgi:hypothetical protein
VTRDWRGTPITPGATVIYGAGIGRSIELVEGIVCEEMLTPTGRIRVQPVRRRAGYSTNLAVSVGADRLVVVDQLAPYGGDQ